MKRLEASHLIRRFVGVIVLVPVVVLLLVGEWNFESRARRGEAVVVDSGIYGGVGSRGYGAIRGKLKD